MGSFTRGKLPHLIEALLAEPSSFSAFQALSLIETSLGGYESVGDELHRYVALTPAREVSFPAGELRRCYRDRDERFRFELNFMGFYGVDSPLPQYFNDITSRDVDGSEPLRAFLDMFNQRLYLLLYDAWKKLNRHGDTAEQKSIYYRYLSAFSGKISPSGRLDHAGIFGGRVKSSQALCGILKDVLNCPVTVQQNIPTWITIDTPTRLGNRTMLGSDTLVGQRIMDVNGHIRIQIGPISSHRAAALYPGESQAKEVATLISEFLDPGVDFDLELHVTNDTSDQLTLNSSHSALGWSGCLGKPMQPLRCIRLTSSSLNADRTRTPRWQKQPLAA
jgi:type VI secretion system protein ImpH